MNATPELDLKLEDRCKPGSIIIENIDGIIIVQNTYNATWGEKTWFSATHVDLIAHQRTEPVELCSYRGNKRDYKAARLIIDKMHNFLISRGSKYATVRRNTVISQENKALDDGVLQEVVGRPDEIRLQYNFDGITVDLYTLPNTQREKKGIIRTKIIAPFYVTIKTGFIPKYVDPEEANKQSFHPYRVGNNDNYVHEIGLRNDMKPLDEYWKFVVNTNSGRGPALKLLMEFSAKFSEEFHTKEIGRYDFFFNQRLLIDKL